MARCALTGKKKSTGNNVSHSKRRTKRTWSPNLVTVKLPDENGILKKMRISTRALKTLNKTTKK